VFLWVLYVVLCVLCLSICCGCRMRGFVVIAGMPLVLSQRFTGMCLLLFCLFSTGIVCWGGGWGVGGGGWGGGWGGGGGM